MRNARTAVAVLAAFGAAACALLLKVDDVAYEDRDGGIRDASDGAVGDSSVADAPEEDAAATPDAAGCVPPCDAATYCAAGQCAQCIDQQLPCTSDFQCCGYAVGDYRCVDAGGSSRCCRPEGNYCGNSTQCCAGYYCTHDFSAIVRCAPCFDAGAPCLLVPDDSGAFAPEGCCSKTCDGFGVCQ